jgi:DNA polymerase-3 subunit delta'
MIEGPAGSGKNALASAMMAKLLCSSDQPEACGQCRSCGLLKGGGAHPDRFELQPEEDSQIIKVDQVRQLISSLNLTTSIGSRKVAYIHPADVMNASSANALLKSLEEPTGDAVLILVSSDSSRLPVTIRSRCQSIVVHQPDEQIAISWLNTTSKKPEADVLAALQAAGGSPLRALQYLESTQVDSYRKVTDGLASLLVKPGSASMVAASLADLDSDDVWRWLSMCASEAAKASLTGQPVNWLASGSGLQNRSLLALQKHADLNRRLSTTTVRNDLLLQDWLIRWAEQTF